MITKELKNKKAYNSNYFCCSCTIASCNFIFFLI